MAESSAPGSSRRRAALAGADGDGTCDTVVGQVRLRIDLAYDGHDFHGWAAQPGQRTVQGVLEPVLALVLRLGESPQLTVAGRTDAGVHARGQVVHVDIPAGALPAPGPAGDVAEAGSATRPREPALAWLLRRLNRLLPDDIRLHALRLAPPGFDARFSALSRRYTYRVCDDVGCLDPLRRRDTLWHPAGLDPARMNQAAVSCLGEHDFAAFCRPRPGATTIRELKRLDWHRADSGVLIGSFVADAFCHHMVRSLTGALLAVGDGRRPVDWPGHVLAAGTRDSAVQVVPPHGLCLEQVSYPPAAALAARAMLTRRLRG